LAGTETYLGDRGGVCHALGPARHNGATKFASATSFGRRANDTDVYICALKIPSGGIPGPFFFAIQHVFSVCTIVSRNEANANRRRTWMIEIGSSPWRSGSFAYRPGGKGFAARTRGCGR